MLFALEKYQISFLLLLTRTSTATVVISIIIKVYTVKSRQAKSDGNILSSVIGMVNFLKNHGGYIF